MLEWLLDGLSEADITVRIICMFFSCLIISQIFGKYLGEDRKNKWFKKRVSKNWILNRRGGFFGEAANFGYPKTREGFMVTGLMLVTWIVVTLIIFKVK